jgi:hypothetical protein
MSNDDARVILAVAAEPTTGSFGTGSKTSKPECFQPDEQPEQFGDSLGNGLHQACSSLPLKFGDLGPYSVIGGGRWRSTGRDQTNQA